MGKSHPHLHSCDSLQMSVALPPVAVLNHESEDEALLSHAHYTLCIFPTKDSSVSIDHLHTMQALENIY